MIKTSTKEEIKQLENKITDLLKELKETQYKFNSKEKRLLKNKIISNIDEALQIENYYEQA